MDAEMGSNEQGRQMGSEDDAIQFVGSGPSLVKAQQYANEWAVASEADSEAFAILMPAIEGMKQSTIYGERFADIQIFDWLGRAGPLVLQDILDRLPKIDCEWRLDKRGLIAYVEGYLDGLNGA